MKRTVAYTNYIPMNMFAFVELLAVLVFSNVALNTGMKDDSDGLYYVGELSTDSPSFVEILDIDGDDTYPDLLVTHFTEVGPNGINVFYNIGQELDNIANGNPPTQTNLYDTTLTWPNYVYIAPNDIFAADVTLIVHDGFLTPLHSNGGVYALLLNNSVAIDLIRLIPKTKSCYYHNSTMIDLNGDGLLDILVAQTCKSLTAEKGTLLWLEQPSDDPNKAESWTIHELIAGPDILIELESVEGYNDQYIVYAAQFWGQKLTYYYLTIGTNGNDPTISKEYIIDDTIGAVYNVLTVDINNDGNKQLLVQNHEASVNVTGIWLYEYPSGFPSNYVKYNESIIANFTKIEIANDFNTTMKTGVGAPGLIYPFHLNVDTDGSEPFRIGVAGDGNYFSWQLIPQTGKSKHKLNSKYNSDKEEIYSYSKELIQTIGGTCGSLGIADVNNDGFIEMFVPYYEKSKLYVFSANSKYACQNNCYF